MAGQGLAVRRGQRGKKVLGGAAPGIAQVVADGGAAAIASSNPAPASRPATTDQIDERRSRTPRRKY
jgi:hypothetical protein